MRLAFTRSKTKPVLKNYAAKTPLVIEDNFSLCVSSPTHVINEIISILRIVFITIIATVMPSPIITAFFLSLLNYLHSAT